MANELIRMKSGLIKNIEKNSTTGQSPVSIQAGTLYFAVDDNKETGKILYDVDSTHRVVMSTQAEYADYAGEAAKATGISGIYPVKGTQTASTANWTGVIQGVNELFDGLTIAYYLPYAGTSTSATLNLTFKNGDMTGAIPVYYTSTSKATTHFGAGSTIILTYWSAGSIKVNGTATAEARWTRADYDSTNIFQLRKNYNGFKPSTNLYGYQILLTKNETDLLPINIVDGSTATNKTLTTDSFDPFGQIYWWNSTSTINANTIIGSWTNLMTQVLADLRYSFNIGNTLTTNKAVYLVAIPQTNGTAKLDSTPIKQTLPAAKDDKIYIYLGQAYSSYQVELMPFHPIYYYKGDKIALYTGEPIATANNSGLMGVDDKIKLDTIEEGAQVNTVTGVKGSSESTYRTGNINITKANIGLGNVENKSSATIRGELTSANVITALGYTPATQDLATADRHGLMDKDDKAIIDQLTVYSISGTSPINASTAGGVATISHADSGVTANTYGATATTAVNPGFGDTFSVPGFKVNGTGHITLAGAHNVKIPATLASPTLNGLMSAEDKGNFDSGVTVAGNTIKIGSSLAADTLRTSLGLSNAMHFIGHATVTITDNSTTDPEILNYAFGVNGSEAQPGDVIIDKDSAYEYVWSSLGRWERLGGDSSYKVVQTAVNDANYTGTTTATTFVSAVTQDTNGVITVTKRKLPTYNNYTHPTYTAKTAAAVKVGNDNTGHVVIGDALTKSDVGLSNVTNDAQIPKSIGTAKGDIIYFSASGTPARLAVGTNGQVLKVNSSGIPAWASDSDSHYITHLYAGASNGNTNAATTNGNTYLIVTDNTTARDRRKIAGTGATTVTSDADGNITINSTNTTYTFDGTYDSSTNKAATVSTVTNAINALDGNLNSTTPGAGKTLTAFSQTNGKVSATFGDISITKSQISDFPTSLAPTSHTHGNIQNGGTLSTASRIVITDSNKKITTASYAHLNTSAGTTSANGYDELVLGNSTASGTAGNTFGRIALYSTGTTGQYIIAVGSGWKNHVLPDSAGWIATGGNGSSTGVGNSTTPIYLSTSGVLTAGTALKALAYKDSLTASDVGAATSGHTHTTSIATSSGTNQITLALGTKYAITAGGTSYVFTMPANPNTDTKVRQTLSTTNENYPLLLAYSNKATTTANVDNISYRNNNIYANPSTGQINAISYKINEKSYISYDTDTDAIGFTFI